MSTISQSTYSYNPLTAVTIIYYNTTVMNDDLVTDYRIKNTNGTYISYIVPAQSISGNSVTFSFTVKTPEFPTSGTVTFSVEKIKKGVWSQHTASSVFTITIQADCFKEGTKILCYSENGDIYIPVEKLTIGTLVKSYLHGYRKIVIIKEGILVNNPDKWNNCMFKMTKKDNMIDDLIVTGGHSILVDVIPEHEVYNNKIYFGIENEISPIDGKQLLLAGVSDQFERLMDTNVYKYYHFALENDYDNQRFGVYANGVLVETPSYEYLKK
jgi:hypothetical protein